MLSDNTEFLEKIEQAGFYIARSLLSAESIDSLLVSLERSEQTKHARKRQGSTYAFRNMLNAIPEIKDIALGDRIFGFVQDVLGPAARPVKATLFDKTPEVNWNLRMHQDNVIAVAERKEAPGFHGWTEKTGIPHVRPPEDILEQMLAARIHLDDCPAENGALIVLPGSHSRGRLSDEDLLVWKQKVSETLCSAAKGDVLFMRPLLLHSSKPSSNPGHRRVLHIEYAGCDLPFGLTWGE